MFILVVNGDWLKKTGPKRPINSLVSTKPDQADVSLQLTTTTTPVYFDVIH